MRAHTARTGRFISAVTIGIATIALSEQTPSAGTQPTPAAGQTPPAGRRQAGPGRGNEPGWFPRVPALPFPDASRDLEMSGTEYRVVPFVKGLQNPWSLTFLPNGDMLVTEKAGRLRVVKGSVLQPQPIAGVPTVWTTGQ